MAQRVNSSEMLEEVLTIRMHTKVTKVGRNLTFAALVAVGNGRGRIGLGYGKASGVPLAIEKANKRAMENMFEVPLIGDTLSHEQIGEHKSSRVLLKPAAPGTGVKAGGTIRGMLQVLGVHNVLTKSLGRNNPINLAQAAVDGLKKMRPVEEVENLRGRKIDLKHPQWYHAKPKEETGADEDEAPIAAAEGAAAEGTEEKVAEGEAVATESDE